MTPAGVNFSLYSRDATAVELLFFDGPSDARPARAFSLDPHLNRTHDYWHVYIPGVRPGQIYAYRVSGPGNGKRFDPQKILLDPYGKAVAMPGDYSRRAAAAPGDNASQAIRSVVVDPLAYDWQGDQPLRRPFVHTVVYEVHVAGLTKHPSSGVAIEKRGIYAGLIEKIPYLAGLGVTAVELMPIFLFDVQDAPRGLGLVKK